MNSTREFNEERDPLEAELRALKPREPSPQFRERIARDLAEVTPPRSHIVWIVTLVGAVAASLLAAVLLWRNGGEAITDNLPPESPQPLVATAFDDTLPSVWSYRSAVNRSPDELDNLLDKHTTLTSSPHTRIQAWTRFDNDLSSLPGEL